MPAIFVGIQIFGSAGWTWSTASLGRISCLAYSLALYMATIGPLTHMQAERRAFWILRTVPVPLRQPVRRQGPRLVGRGGRRRGVCLRAAGGVMSPAPFGSVVAAGLLVVGGAVSMTFLAIAMAAGGPDLSDEQTTAVGPATIYAFLLVGGLYNLVLTGDPRTRLSGLALYLFVTAAYWGAGVARAEICLDAEAVRAPRLRAADAATLLLIYALGARGLGTAAASAQGGILATLLGIRLGWVALLGVVALVLPRRAPAVPDRRGLAASTIAGVVVAVWARSAGGVFHRGACRLLGRGAAELAGNRSVRRRRRGHLPRRPSAVTGRGPRFGRSCRAGRFVWWPASSAQRWAWWRSPSRRRRRPRRRRAGAPRAISLAISLQIVAALVRGVTGRVSASAIARLAALAVCTFL